MPFSDADLAAVGLTLRLAGLTTLLLLLAGTPLGEPIAHYGPFVMNTEEEIRQAIADYRSGDFTRAQ